MESNNGAIFHLDLMWLGFRRIFHYFLSVKVGLLHKAMDFLFEFIKRQTSFKLYLSSYKASQEEILLVTSLSHHQR